MAALDFDYLKQIEPKCKSLVFGYIRNVQSSLLKSSIYYNIPIGIINVCVLFFGNMHEWDASLKSRYLEINKNKVTAKKQGWNSIWLKNTVSTGKHIW